MVPTERSVKWFISATVKIKIKIKINIVIIISLFVAFLEVQNFCE